MLKAPVDARVALNPHGQAVKPVTVPDQFNRDASSVPTYVMAKGAGCPPANVTLTDSVRGLETAPRSGGEPVGGLVDGGGDFRPILDDVDRLPA